MLYTLAYRVEFFLDSTQLARKKIVLARVEKVSNHKICVRDSANKDMFRHLHEIQTGRTSSISHEILGFDSEGTPVDYSTCSTAEEICENATKLFAQLV